MTAGVTDVSRPDHVTKELIREELRAVLASRAFRRAARLRKLLSYLVEASLADPAGTLKEYTIATDVFGRPESFDPGKSPIVRVEARRLRSKLDQYYSSEGGGGRVRIELPRGSYLPVFLPTGEPGLWDRPKRRTSIAILPFSCLGRTKELGYFSRGLTVELAHGLSGLAEARIVACEKRPQDTGVAGALGVDWVLDCTIRKESRRFRISAQLIRVADGSLCWSDMRESGSGARITSQQEIALAIAGGVSSVLGLANAR